MSAQIYKIFNNINQTMNTGTITLGGNITQPNNVNMGNLLSKWNSIQSIANITSGSDLKFSANVKKYEVYETTEDLLALSCAWYRIRQARKNNDKVALHITSMLSDELFSCLHEQDRLYANEIRDYYSKKLMIFNLKGQKLTRFRQDLTDFLHGDSRKFVEKYIPMVYRLPEFYLNDLSFDEVKHTFERELPKTIGLKVLTRILTPVLKLTKNNKSHGKTFEYWLRDSDNYAYCFRLRPENSLLGLWDNTFSNSQISLNFKYSISRRDELEYYTITGITN